MVKKILICLVVCFYVDCFAQKQENLWWLKDDLSNPKHKKKYEYTFSIIKEGLLKQVIKNFIKTYLKNISDETAIEISVISSKDNNIKKYQITYITNYYNYLKSVLNTQQISKINDKIILVKDSSLKDFTLSKDIIFSMLRNRFPKQVKKLNNEYKSYNNKNIIPVIIPDNEHDIPYMTIEIKGDSILKKEVVFD